MPPKKTILRELRRANERDGGHGYVRPPTIPGYSSRPDRYQRAVNELLQARLVEGHKDEDGRLAIALNPHRLGEVERLLRPVWARPVVWIALLVVAVAAGLVA